MANASVGAVRIIDGDGDIVESDGSGRLKVETEQDDAFGTWVTYPDFEAATTATAISDGSNGIGVSVTSCKEIIIQADFDNTGYLMVGDSGATADTEGIRLHAGDTLVLPVSSTANVSIDASASSQTVNVTIIT